MNEEIDAIILALQDAIARLQGIKSSGAAPAPEAPAEPAAEAPAAPAEPAAPAAEAPAAPVLDVDAQGNPIR